MPADKCEYYYRCRFIQRHKQNPKVIDQGLEQKYCQDWFNSEDCERKTEILNSDCGCQPVENLAPTGEYL